MSVPSTGRYSVPQKGVDRRVTLQLYVYIYIYRERDIHMCMYVLYTIYVYLYEYRYMCIYIYIYVYHIYIYIYICIDHCGVRRGAPVFLDCHLLEQAFAAPVVALQIAGAVRAFAAAWGEGWEPQGLYELHIYYMLYNR